MRRFGPEMLCSKAAEPGHSTVSTAGIRSVCLMSACSGMQTFPYRNIPGQGMKRLCQNTPDLVQFHRLDYDIHTSRYERIRHIVVASLTFHTRSPGSAPGSRWYPFSLIVRWGPAHGKADARLYDFRGLSQLCFGRLSGSFLSGKNRFRVRGRSQVNP